MILRLGINNNIYKYLQISLGELCNYTVRKTLIRKAVTCRQYLGFSPNREAQHHNTHF